MASIYYRQYSYYILLSIKTRSNHVIIQDACTAFTVQVLATHLWLLLILLFIAYPASSAFQIYVYALSKSSQSMVHCRVFLKNLGEIFSFGFSKHMLSWQNYNNTQPGGPPVSSAFLWSRGAEKKSHSCVMYKRPCLCFHSIHQRW